MKAEDTPDRVYFPPGHGKNQSAEILIFGKKYTDFDEEKPFHTSIRSFHRMPFASSAFSGYLADN
jgi:hypothetical protein